MSNETSADFITDDLSDIQLAVTDAVRPLKAAPQGSKEHRTEPRFRVKWPATVIVNEQNSHRGLIKDISTKGAAVLLDAHLHSTKFVNIRIHLPSLNAATGPRTIEIYGKIVYSIHDSNEFLFRTGVSFLKFHQESDQAHLSARLTNHHIPI
jgi:hypothetical protein